MLLHQVQVKDVQLQDRMKSEAAKERSGQLDDWHEEADHRLLCHCLSTTLDPFRILQSKILTDLHHDWP